MTDEEFQRQRKRAMEWTDRMRECADQEPEGAHADADDLLLEIILELGGEMLMRPVVEAYDTMEKWYA